MSGYRTAPRCRFWGVRKIQPAGKRFCAVYACELCSFCVGCGWRARLTAAGLHGIGKQGKLRRLKEPCIYIVSRRPAASAALYPYRAAAERQYPDTGFCARMQAPPPQQRRSASAAVGMPGSLFSLKQACDMCSSSLPLKCRSAVISFILRKAFRFETVAPVSVSADCRSCSSRPGNSAGVFKAIRMVGAAYGTLRVSPKPDIFLRVFFQQTAEFFKFFEAFLS